jgi:hypothetical protein
MFPEVLALFKKMGYSKDEIAELIGKQKCEEGVNCCAADYKGEGCCNYDDKNKYCMDIVETMGEKMSAANVDIKTNDCNTLFSWYKDSLNR